MSKTDLSKMTPSELLVADFTLRNKWAKETLVKLCNDGVFKCERAIPDLKDRAEKGLCVASDFRSLASFFAQAAESAEREESEIMKNVQVIGRLTPKADEAI